MKIYSVWDDYKKISKFYSSQEQGELALELLIKSDQYSYASEDFRLVTDYVYEYVYEQED